MELLLKTFQETPELFLLGVIFLLSISEAMALIPYFKSNGILHFGINFLKALKRNINLSRGKKYE